MKVLHIAEAFGGGIVEFVYQLATNMPEAKHTLLYSQREIDINSIRAKFPSEMEFIEWRYAQREINIQRDYKAFLFLKCFLKKFNFDVIHLHSSKAGFLGRLATKVVKVENVIYTPNGAPFVRQDIGVVKKIIFIILEWIASKVNGRVICSSKSESELYRKYSISSTYINNGIKQSVAKNLARQKKDIIRICTAGRVCLQKNPSLFNDIAKRFRNSRNIDFIWIGEGELEHELTSDNIKTTGWLSKEEVLQIVFDSDLYLSTALWEGLPFAVLEAMSLSKPLLLKNCVGNIDLVKKGVNGFLFNNGTEAECYINLILDNPELLPKLGSESKKFFTEEFTALKMVKGYLNIYKSYSKEVNKN